MRHIAIIPARAGSKAIAGKNLRKLGHQSLVHRALTSACDAGIFDDVVLTTDIEDLIEERDTPWAIHSRSSALCQDETTMSPVVLDVLRTRMVPERAYVWLLQPTSPFRLKEDYAAILTALGLPETSSVISVTHVGDSHPSRHYTLSPRYQDLKPILGAKAAFERRQDLRPVYERNGLYYVTRVEDFLRHQTFFITRCKPYLVPKERSRNINDEHDLRLAQAEAQWV